MALTIPEFGHKNRDLLIIVADPKTDEVYFMYKDTVIRGQVGEKTKKGKIKTGVVKNILTYGRFKDKQNGIERFIMELAGAMHFGGSKAKYFFSAVYDGLYALAARKRRVEKGN